MSQRQSIISILQRENELTQSEIALRYYGDSEHNTAIFTALQKMVQDGLLSKSNDRPAKYSLLRTQAIPHTTPTTRTRIKVETDYSDDKKMAYYTIWDINNLIYRATEMAGRTMNPGTDFYVVWQPRGHEPASLPRGKMAVYSFHYGDCCLKVGQVGPNTGSRYYDNHYKVIEPGSTLANSIVNSGEFGNISSSDVGEWIKNNCERFDIIMNVPENENRKIILNMIEGIMQMYFRPKFEG